jgi:hypothetical protein
MYSTCQTILLIEKKMFLRFVLYASCFMLQIGQLLYHPAKAAGLLLCYRYAEEQLACCPAKAAGLFICYMCTA